MLSFFLPVLQKELINETVVWHIFSFAITSTLLRFLWYIYQCCGPSNKKNGWVCKTRKIKIIILVKPIELHFCKKCASNNNTATVETIVNLITHINIEHAIDYFCFVFIALCLQLDINNQYGQINHKTHGPIWRLIRVSHYIWVVLWCFLQLTASLMGIKKPHSWVWLAQRHTVYCIG